MKVKPYKKLKQLHRGKELVFATNVCTLHRGKTIQKETSWKEGEIEEKSERGDEFKVQMRKIDREMFKIEGERNQIEWKRDESKKNLQKKGEVKDYTKIKTKTKIKKKRYKRNIDR